MMINCLSSDAGMDFVPDVGEKRRNTGGILSIFAETRRKIGSVDVRQ
jgi:hypothetical protein